MKAIVLTAHGGSENFRIEELPPPPIRPGDVRVRVRAAAFNPVDYQVRRGVTYGSTNRSAILGRDLSGVVESAAPDVAGFAPGDEVYSYICNRASSGAYAELVSVPAELLARKPRRLSHDEAAAVPVAGITACLALEKVQAQPTKSLFVAGGAGGVGSFVLALARQMGLARIVTTAGSAISQAYLTHHLRRRRTGSAQDFQLGTHVG